MWRQESTVNLKNPTLIVSAGAVIAFAAIAGLTAAGAANTGPAVPAAIAAQSNSADPIPFTGAPNYRAIVAANRAAVVGITTESKAGDADDNDDEDDSGQGNAPQFNGRGNGRDNPFGDNPFFRFFGQPNPRNQEQVPVRALGSGFIVSPNG
jgi:hypothetical protein